MKPWRPRNWTCPYIPERLSIYTRKVKTETIIMMSKTDTHSSVSVTLCRSIFVTGDILLQKNSCNFTFSRSTRSFLTTLKSNMLIITKWCHPSLVISLDLCNLRDLQESLEVTASQNQAILWLKEYCAVFIPQYSFNLFLLCQNWTVTNAFLWTKQKLQIYVYYSEIQDKFTNTHVHSTYQLIIGTIIKM